MSFLAPFSSCWKQLAGWRSLGKLLSTPKVPQIRWWPFGSGSKIGSRNGALVKGKKTKTCGPWWLNSDPHPFTPHFFQGSQHWRCLTVSATSSLAVFCGTVGGLCEEIRADEGSVTDHAVPSKVAWRFLRLAPASIELRVLTQNPFVRSHQ